MTTQAGQEQGFEAKMRPVVPKARLEPGNYAYSTRRSHDNSHDFMSYEGYADSAAFDAHRQPLRAYVIAQAAIVATADHPRTVIV